MTRDEEEQLTSLISSNPGLQVTPQVLIQFIAMQTTIGDQQGSDPSPPQTSPDEFEDRGRMEERDYDGYNSRSSSRDSTATYHRSSSRGPPATPRESVFDSGRRARTTPLNNNTAPSSWARRPPPSRRKSDAGQGHNRALSDSEVRIVIHFMHDVNDTPFCVRANACMMGAYHAFVPTSLCRQVHPPTHGRPAARAHPQIPPAQRSVPLPSRSPLVHRRSAQHPFDHTRARSLSHKATFRLSTASRTTIMARRPSAIPTLDQPASCLRPRQTTHLTTSSPSTTKSLRWPCPAMGRTRTRILKSRTNYLGWSWIGRRHHRRSRSTWNNGWTLCKG